MCDDRIMFSLPCDTDKSDNTSEDDMIGISGSGQTIYVPPYIVLDERHLSPGLGLSSLQVPSPTNVSDEEDITPSSQTRMNEQRKETIPKQSQKAAEWAIRKLQQFLKKRNKVINFKEVSETRLAKNRQIKLVEIEKINNDNSLCFCIIASTPLKR